MQKAATSLLNQENSKNEEIMKNKLTTILEFLDRLQSTKERCENIKIAREFFEELLEQQTIQDKAQAARDFLDQLEKDHERDANLKLAKAGVIALLDTVSGNLEQAKENQLKKIEEAKRLKTGE